MSLGDTRGFSLAAWSLRPSSFTFSFVILIPEICSLNLLVSMFGVRMFILMRYVVMIHIRMRHIVMGIDMRLIGMAGVPVRIGMVYIGMS